jgi:hypothetical protein
MEREKKKKTHIQQTTQPLMTHAIPTEKGRSGTSNYMVDGHV